MATNGTGPERGPGGLSVVVPAGWGEPGYVPANKAPLGLGIQLTLTAIMIIVVALRIYTRMFLVRALGWDDVFILMASVSCVGLITLHSLLYRDGMGLHMIDAIQKNVGAFREIALLGFLASLIHIVTMYLIKMSILLFVHRIVARGRTVNIVYILYVAVTLFAVASFLLYTFQCSPVKAFWSYSYTGPRKCLSVLAVLYFNAIGNALLDVALLLLPMPDLLSIQINRRDKAVVVGIFAVGGIATLASIIRAAWMGHFHEYSDITWRAADPMVLTGVEPLLGIICCSVPALKKWFSKVFGAFLSTASLRSRSLPRSHPHPRSSHGVSMAMHLRRDTSGKPPKTTESTEEFKSDLRAPLEHKFQSTPNNTVIIETASRDTLEMENESAPGRITVRTEYSQTVVDRT